MNDRDMFYNSYGYGGYIPMNNIPPTNNNQNLKPTPYMSNQLNDMNERINRLERQIKRLDQRLTRLETPYLNSNNEPDNNMYMM